MRQMLSGEQQQNRFYRDVYVACISPMQVMGVEGDTASNVCQGHHERTARHQYHRRQLQ
jgi:hypothetical protein